MVSVCLGMVDGDSRSSRRESESSLRDACAAFQAAQQALAGPGGQRRKEVTLATRLATHAAFLLADLLRQLGRPRDAADVLVRASRDESALSSAILLEQAAWCFKAHRFDRKFAFHIILAGIKYQAGGLEQHAVRCFQESTALYEGKQWVHIQDYVYAHLAKHLGLLKDFPHALESYLKIVGTGRQSAERQQRFVREFTELCTNHPDALASVVEAQAEAAVAKEAEEAKKKAKEGAAAVATTAATAKAEGKNTELAQQALEAKRAEPAAAAADVVLSDLGVPLVLDAKLAVYQCQNANGTERYNAAKLPPAEVEEWRVMALEMEAEIAAAKRAAHLGVEDHLIEECAKAAVELEEATARRQASSNSPW
jgi:hypothetical protein